MSKVQDLAKATVFYSVYVHLCAYVAVVSIDLTFCLLVLVSAACKTLYGFHRHLSIIITMQAVSEIGAMVKVTDSHSCGWASIPGKSCGFFIVNVPITVFYVF